MPLWANLYLLVFAAWTLWSVIASFREGDWRDATATLVGMSAWTLLFVSYFGSITLGRVAAPLFLGAFFWTGFIAQRNIRAEHRDLDVPEHLHSTTVHFGLALSAVMYSPAVAFGLIAAVRDW